MPVQDYSKRINRAGMVGAIVTANVRAIVAAICSDVCSGVYWDIYYGGCCGRLFGCSFWGWSEQLLRAFVRVFVGAIHELPLHELHLHALHQPKLPYRDRPNRNCSLGIAYS